MRLLLLFLCLAGCSKPQVAGGVTEVGNGVVILTVTASDGSPAGAQPVYLTSAEYVAASVEPSSKPVTTSATGEVILSAEAGRYALFAEHSEAMGLRFCKIQEGDTMHIAIQLAPVASVRSTQKAITEIAIPGAPRLFAADGGVVNLPSGTYTAMIRDSAGATEQTVNLYPGSDLTLAETATETALFATGTNSRVRSLYATDSVLAVGTSAGAVVLTHGKQSTFTEQSGALLSNLVNAVTVQNDTLFAGTDSGVVLIPLTEKTPTTLLRGEWITQFLPISEGVCYLSLQSVGVIANGAVSSRVGAEDILFAGDPMTIAAVTDSGTVIGANKRGLFEYRNSQWELFDAGLERMNLTSPVRVLELVGDTIFVASMDGVFIRSANLWKKLSIEDLVLCSVKRNGAVLVGTSAGGVRELTDAAFPLVYSAGSGVTAMTGQNKRLIIGTASSGVVILE